MADPGDEERLKALGERIKAAKGEPEPKSHMDDHYAQASQAWRMVIELVAGIAIGAGIGLGLDTLLGTRPWLLIVLTLLGFAAGVKTMLQTARELQKEAGQGPDKKRDGDGGDGS